MQYFKSTGHEVKWKSLSCEWLFAMDYTLPGSSVHGILQARILKWVAIPFSRETSQPRDQTQISHTAGRFFTVWTTRKALDVLKKDEISPIKMKNKCFSLTPGIPKFLYSLT